MDEMIIVLEDIKKSVVLKEIKKGFERFLKVEKRKKCFQRPLMNFKKKKLENFCRVFKNLEKVLETVDFENGPSLVSFSCVDKILIIT